MRIHAAISGPVLALAIAVGFGAAMATADASAMSKKEKRTVIGAVVGGLGGSLLSGGDPWATVGGALAGGTVGNVTTKDRDRDHRWDHDRRNGRDNRSNWQREQDRRRWEREQYRRYRGR